MKSFTVLFSALYSLSCFSQEPDPQLFQTWYLSQIVGDFSPSFNVSEIVPAITPTLTISNDLNFTGEGACNSFNGSFTNVTSYSFETTLFSSTELICSTQTHNLFELNYFDFLQSTLYYQIYPQGQGYILTLTHPLMAQEIFQNFPLKTSEFDSDKITIYPNPTDSTVFLNLEQLVVSKIQVVNSIGQNVMTIKNDFESINIGDLNSGIYILKIETDLGPIIKKIVRK